MKVVELKRVLDPNRTVEISTPIGYYYGLAKNIKRKLYECSVIYVGAGTADSNEDDNECVLVDAK